MTHSFANILLTGRCNLRCPFCIGNRLQRESLPENLGLFPLHGLEAFTARIREEGVREVSITGTNTDPQLYRHEAELLDYLRSRIPGVRISLHTNGLLALAKLDIFNRYDRASISFPSFTPSTYFRMTGRREPIDLGAILKATCIPVKISTVVTKDNEAEVPSLIETCAGMGVKRLVLRALYGSSLPENVVSGTPSHWFGGNPVYRQGGLEITLWDFSRSSLRCLNLFSNGTVTTQYEIANHEQHYVRHSPSYGTNPDALCLPRLL